MAGNKDKLHLSAAAIAVIAATAHEANAAFCRSLGDDSQPSWADAPDWQTASAIDGVEFHIGNPDAGDAASHENWMKAKKADGWQYGETKDPEKKLHPCMVPFKDLPREQQFKDALFRSIVHAAAPLLAPIDEAAAAAAGHEQTQADLAEAREGTSASAARIAELEEELAAARRSIAAHKGATTRAKSTVAELEARGKPRKVGAMSGEALGPDDLLELIADAETVEVAFSDGRSEVAGLGARQVSGEAWTKTPAGVKLSVGADDFTVAGPGEGQRPFAIAGYALLLDGEQVAYKPRHEQISIGAGQRFNLSDDVVF